MKTIFQRATIAIAFAAASIGAAHASGLTGTAADFGSQTNSVADRVINIDANTKSVKVDDGETVQFNVDGKMFTWHFDTFTGETAFDLSKIAPTGVNVQGVHAYVGANPLYRG